MKAASERARNEITGRTACPASARIALRAVARLVEPQPQAPRGQHEQPPPHADLEPALDPRQHLLVEQLAGLDPGQAAEIDAHHRDALGHGGRRRLGLRRRGARQQEGGGCGDDRGPSHPQSVERRRGPG